MPYQLAVGIKGGRDYSEEVIKSFTLPMVARL